MAILVAPNVVHSVAKDVSDRLGAVTVDKKVAAPVDPIEALFVPNPNPRLLVVISYKKKSLAPVTPSVLSLIKRFLVELAPK